MVHQNHKSSDLKKQNKTKKHSRTASWRDSHCRANEGMGVFFALTHVPCFSPNCFFCPNLVKVSCFGSKLDNYTQLDRSKVMFIPISVLLRDFDVITDKPNTLCSETKPCTSVLTGCAPRANPSLRVARTGCGSQGFDYMREKALPPSRMKGLPVGV